MAPRTAPGLLGRTWRVARRSFWDTWDEDALNVSAQLAYYYFLAVFPGLVFFVALLGYLPVEGATSGLLEAVRKTAPQQVGDLLGRELSRLFSERRADLLLLGIGGALWSGSSAMASTIHALNRAYDVDETRSWWRQRLVALLLTAGLGAFGFLALIAIVSGPDVGRWLAQGVGAGRAFDAAWSVLRWPVAFALVVAAVDLVFRFAPNANLRWVWLSPGSIVATALWLVVSLGFRLYVRNFGSFAPMYGTLGGVIVVLLWFYLSAFALLVGGIVDAAADSVADESGEPGAKGSGRRKS